jgi:G3E family GTPase
MIPLTIFTGFLGSGKTTLINTIIEQNKNIRFGLIINEFGEVGIDGQIIDNSGEELVEMSNGCLCCVVRKDLEEAVMKIAQSGKVDYILIEASGLAEPMPIAQTFAMNDLNGAIQLDSVVATLDASNYMVTKDTYKIAVEQIEFADIIVLNKLNEASESDTETITQLIYKINPEAQVIHNDNDFNSQLLIETGRWSIDKLSEHNTDHDSHDHHNHEHQHKHEHDEVDEVVFTTTKILNPEKMDDWMQNKFPKNVIRAKGFLRLPIPTDDQPFGIFLFQMVGSKKKLDQFTPTRPDFDKLKSIIVLIGKKINKTKVLEDLSKCVMD